MTKCWNCESSIPTNFVISNCSRCGCYYHISGDVSYPVPVVKIDETDVSIEIWQGYGPNLIQEINLDPHGMKNTRIGVLEKLFNIRVTGNKNKRQRMIQEIDQALAYFGLKFSLFEIRVEKLYDTKLTSMSQFRSSPGGICAIDQEDIRLDVSPTKHEIIEDGLTNSPQKKKSAEWIIETLNRMYPGQKLHREQEEAISHSVGVPGSLTSVVLPTGKGKTRIAQALAISNVNGHGYNEEKEGPVLILYPTISLMDDQKKEWIFELNEDLEKAGLRKLNVKVWHSGEDEEEVDAIGSELISGEIDVLLCSPESLTKNTGKVGLLEIAMRLNGNCKGLPFSAIVIDEVHILYDWGDSIRDAYLYIDKHEKLLRKINPELRTIFLTATLTPREETELIEQKFKRDKELVKRVRDTTVRKDLAFSMIIDYEQNIEAASETIWREYARNIPNRYKSKSPLLIYTFRPDDCDRIAKHLRSMVGRKNIEIYSGKTPKGSRKKILKKFQNNEIKLLVATSAFGMGVNKSDVWMIGYVGMPGTLRELYQSFGRAARGSGWDRNNHSKKNGNCIAIISGRRMTSYKSTLGPAKAIERIIPMIKNGVVTTNGYFLFRIKSRNHIFWNPYDEIEYKTRPKVQERLNEYIRYRQRNGYPRNKLRHLEEEWLEHQYQEMIKKRRKEEFSKSRKALIYLEEAGDIEIISVLPFQPVTSDSYDNIVEIIEAGGEEEIISTYSKIEFSNNSQINRTPSDLVVISKLKNKIELLADIFESVEKGNKKFEAWARDNQRELETFLKGNGKCLRIGFLPAVGGSVELTKSCEEEFRTNENDPLDDDEDPIVPCSVCRKKIWIQNPLHATNSNLRFDGKPPYGVWLNENSLDYLSGRIRKEIDTSKSYSDVLRLPAANFHLGFQAVFDKDEDKRINTHSPEILRLWIELIRNNSEQIYRDQYKIKINDLYDKNGDKTTGDFNIIIDAEQGQILNTIDLQIDDGGDCYGGMLFIDNNKIICRLVNENSAIKAFKHMKEEIEDLSKIFIGVAVPDLHKDQVFRSWESV